MKRKTLCTPHSVHKSQRIQRVVKELSTLDEATRQRIQMLAPEVWTRPWFEQMIEACIGRKKLLAWDVETVVNKKATSTTVIVHLTFWPEIANAAMYAGHLAHVLELECYSTAPAGTLFRVVTHRAPTS